MRKEALQAILDQLPAGTQVYIRQRDDAYPAKARIFSEDGVPENVLYLQVDVDRADEHRNFPEGYSGVKELKLKPAPRRVRARV